MIETAKALDTARARLKAARLTGIWVGVAEGDLQRAASEHQWARDQVDWWRDELRRSPGAADKPIWVPSRMGGVTLRPAFREPGEDG